MTMTARMPAVTATKPVQPKNEPQGTEVPLDPILAVALDNINNNNRAISAEAQVKRLQERIDNLEDLLIRVSRMMSNNEMPDGYRGLQGDISKAIGGQRWA